MGNQYVYDFSEGAGLGRELLGGKGVGLAEMTALGLPVPAGFTVTTEACLEYMRLEPVPDGLAAEVDQAVARLEERTGKRSATLPTRCSCRCARVRRSRCPG